MADESESESENSSCKGEKTVAHIEKMLDNFEKLDHFAVIAEIDIYCVNIDSSDDNGKKKLKLKKALLEELLKVKKIDNEDYIKQLEHVKNELKERSKSFNCCFFGCRFQGRLHKEFINHIKATHPRANNILCNFKHTCKQIFSNVELLISHIKETHSSELVKKGGNKERRQINICEQAVRCNMNSCGGIHLPSVKHLMTHYNTFHVEEARDCIFDSCEHKFGISQTSKKHFRTKHIKKGSLLVKSAFRLPGSDEVIDYDVLPPHSDSHSVEYAEYDNLDIEDIEESAAVFTEDDEQYFKMYYANYLNCLAHVKFIPHSTLQELSEEFMHIVKLSQDYQKKKMKAAMLESGISDEIIETSIKNVFQHSPLEKAHEALNTDYKRLQFIEENFSYLKPREIILNRKEVKTGVAKDVIHYIPIEETLRQLLEDESFNKMMSQGEVDGNEYITDDTIRDICDGSLYKKNVYFKNNPQAYPLLLYSDGVEMKNPLGSARGLYKVVQVFMTLANIPKNQRCQVDRLQLVMVFREKFLKKYSQAIIFKELFKSLKNLEGGISVTVDGKEKFIKAGLLLYASDNLEAHQLGGFSQSFSTKSVCRRCHIQYEDLDNNINDFDGENAFERWTRNEYDRILRKRSVTTDFLSTSDSDGESCISSGPEEAGSDNDEDNSDLDHGEESEDEQIENWGLKEYCLFNKLQSFHCIEGLPFDLMHDFYEGIIPEDLLSIIRILASKGWLTIEDYNKKLKKYDWTVFEAGDKPDSLPLKNNIKKLRGKAMSNYVHCRNWPLLVKEFVKDNCDKVLSLGLKLHEICERISASEFKEYEIGLLEEVILEYMSLRKVVRQEFPDYFNRPKPKHHYINHYPEMIRECGPPRAYMTAYFERAHRLAKNIAETSKNVKNISKTLSERQQLRRASIFYRGMFNTNKFTLPETVYRKEDLDLEENFQRTIAEFSNYGDIFSKQITVNGVLYSQDDLMVSEVIDSDNLKVAIIRTILVRNNQVFFLARIYRCRRHWLGYFESQDSGDFHSFINFTHFPDYKPLGRHGTTVKFRFFLHHRISFL